MRVSTEKEGVKDPKYQPASALRKVSGGAEHHWGVHPMERSRHVKAMARTHEQDLANAALPVSSSGGLGSRSYRLAHAIQRVLSHLQRELAGCNEDAVGEAQARLDPSEDFRLRDWRRVPFASEYLGPWRVATHGQIEWPLGP